MKYTTLNFEIPVGYEDAVSQAVYDVVKEKIRVDQEAAVLAANHQAIEASKTEFVQKNTNQFEKIIGT